MKHLKNLVIATVLFTGIQSYAQAKVAHIDVQSLMAVAPDVKSAQAQLEKLKTDYDKEYQVMTQEFQAKLQKYQQEEGTVGDAVNETRMKELQEMNSRIQQYAQTAQTELGKKELELLKPIMEKAQAAIKKVAAAKGFDYVLDATAPGTVLVANGPDIIEDVKKELGIQ